MNKKRCSFTNCNTKPNEVTFFAFPKDPIRGQIWLDVSGADPFENPKYLCEKHFSHIYISINQRRKLLLTTAVPHAEPNITSSNSNSNDDYRILKATPEQTLPSILHPLSVSPASPATSTVSLENNRFEFDCYNYSSNSNKINTEDRFIEEEYVDIDDETIVKLNNDMSLDKDNIDQQFSEINEPHVETIVSTSTIIQAELQEMIPTTTTITAHDKIANKKNYQKSNNDLILNDSTIENFFNDENNDCYGSILNDFNTESNCEQCTDSNNNSNMHQKKKMKFDSEFVEKFDGKHPEITTFIYKGEEYIQMPKRLYMEQKKITHDEITLYKSLIIDFKNKLDSLFE